MTTRLAKRGPLHWPRAEYGQARQRPNGHVLGCVAMRETAGVSPCAPPPGAPQRGGVMRRGGAPSRVGAALAFALALACGAAPDDEPRAHTHPPAPPAAGDAETPSGAAADGGQLVAGEYGGTYSVPVAPQLEPYAAFEVESVRFERSSSELRLSYDLPELLLGERRRVSFRGAFAADGRHVLDGDDGVATCQTSASGVRCDEVLRAPELDMDGLERRLVGLPEPEARARRAVAAAFSIDPIGVLSVELER